MAEGVATFDFSPLNEVFGEIVAGRPLAILTGAGISAESGVPTFRGPGGLWEGRRIEEVATPEAFAADPDGVWRFYEERRRALASVRPNDGHLALARLERLLPRVTLVTQNVDGLHRAAGSSAVVEIHGSLARVRCSSGGEVFAAPPPSKAPAPPHSGAPRCPSCGGRLRPDVTWFGEALPAEAWDAACRAAAGAALFLVVGTSAVVTPAADLATWAARAGAVVVEVNVEETRLSPLVDFSFRGRASDVLPALVRALVEATGA